MAEFSGRTGVADTGKPGFTGGDGRHYGHLLQGLWWRCRDIDELRCRWRKDRSNSNPGYGVLCRNICNGIKSEVLLRSGGYWLNGCASLFEARNFFMSVNTNYQY